MSDWARLGMEWTEVGTVSRVSPYGLQLAEFPGRWFNASRYHPELRVPEVGTRVTIYLDETGRYVNGIERRRSEHE